MDNVLKEHRWPILEIFPGSTLPLPLRSFLRVRSGQVFGSAAPRYLRMTGCGRDGKPRIERRISKSGTTSHQLRTTSHQLRTTSHQLRTTSHQLTTTSPQLTTNQYPACLASS